MPVPALLKFHADEGGNVHGPGQNGGVAVGGAVAGDDAQQFALVQLDRLAGGQIIGHQDDRLIHLHAGGALAGQDIYHPSGDVPDVGGPGLHILVVHGGEGGGKVFSGCGDGGLRCDVLGIQNALNGVQIVLVLQHHLVHFKDGRVVLADLFQRLLVQRAQLFLGALPGLVKAGPFLFRGQAGGRRSLGGRLAVKPQRADGDAV